MLEEVLEFGVFAEISGVSALALFSFNSILHASRGGARLSARRRAVF